MKTRSKRVSNENSFEVELARLELELERERAKARPSAARMEELARQRSDLLLTELAKWK